MQMNNLNVSRLSNTTSVNNGLSVYGKILIDHQKYKDKKVDSMILKK
jgi:hypothetical protein